MGPEIHQINKLIERAPVKVLIITWLSKLNHLVREQCAMLQRLSCQIFNNSVIIITLLCQSK